MSTAPPWPKCPHCGGDMWVGHVGAPVRVVKGCSACGTEVLIAVQTALFDEDEEEAC
jgi:uncharacterized protein (DUF983 family)